MFRGDGAHRLLRLCLIALSSSSVALTAQAQKDVAGCKPVLDANIKTTATPHHSYSTQTRDGKSQQSESIVVNGKQYVFYLGAWHPSDMTIDEMTKLEQKNIDSSTVYTCKATGATSYHVHQENARAKYDGDVWVERGLLVRTEQDIIPAGGRATMHVSTKYDYANVAAPPGV